MEEYLIRPSDTVWTALHQMGETDGKCLVVIDQQRRVIGTLSDGDLRRAILRGCELTSSVEAIYFDNPVVLEEGSYSQQKVKKIFQQKRFELLPVTDQAGKITQLLTWNSVVEKQTEPRKKELNVPVVIMAGGRGTRLAPFTSVLPKPLIPVDDKPIIQHIIDRFVDFGINEVILTINYKSKILKAYFDELEPIYSVDFIEETDPLGTAGALRFLKKELDKPFLVTNCDVIIDTDYAKLVSFHKERDNMLTLVGSTKKLVVPYGTCTLNSQGNLEVLEEKPEYQFIVNTGLYVLNPEILQLVPEGEVYHITDLIRDASIAGYQIGVYLISEGNWIDVGEWPEYRKAVTALTL
jgi:dTDP-glucose pyrophosphorylase